MTLLLVPALAAAWLAGDLPTATKQKQLAPYFAPAPGAEVVIDPAELRDFGKTKKAGQLRGYIRVSPPKNVCFTITRNEGDPDDTICKPTTLSFSLLDLDKFGRLRWGIVTGDGDFGTPLFWRSQYRVAITTPMANAPEDPPVYEFITNCRAERQDFGGRRLFLELVGGKIWVVAFPDKDTMIPQPEAEANLFIVGANPSGKVSVKDAAAANTEAPKGEHGEAPPPPPKEVKTVDVMDGREIWSIPVRGTYEMPSTNFMPKGSVAPGAKGKCRYTYKGPEEDPKTGRIECLDADGYHHALLPATCLSALKPS